MTYLSSTLTISRKWNENLSKFKNFHHFPGFALHCESAESAENWQNYVLLADKRFDHFLSELKLISNLKSPKKLIQVSFLLESNNKGYMIEEFWSRLVYSFCTTPQALKTNYLTYLSSAFKILRKKMKNFQNLKISLNSADLLRTTNSRNRRKVEKTLYY